MALFRCGGGAASLTPVNVLAMEETTDASARSTYTFADDYKEVFVSIHINRTSGSGLTAGVVFTPTLAAGTADAYHDPAQGTHDKFYKAVLYNVKAGDSIANTGSTYAQTGAVATWDITGVN